jgi:3-phenylpropionate/trans-cinnamate dioxygenase ferredoxin reductase component
VVVLDAETGPPYDKPQLSKKLHPATELELLVEPGLLAADGIDLRPGVEALALDVDRRVVETSAGPVAYDDVVLATGSRARGLGTPLPARASSIRTRQDWNRLRGVVAVGGHLVVVGGGFLGLEAAAAATASGLEVTVVDVADRVLTRGVPAHTSARVAAKHTSVGVTLRLGVQDPVLSGDEQLVEVAGVTGTHALVAVGAVPNVEWLEGSGLALDSGVVCGTDLVAAPGVWAAGDCARWVNARYGRLERHEHWTTAVRHGQHVAASIASGTRRPMAELPYVWSDQYDWRIQSVGRLGTVEEPFVTERGAEVVVSTTDDLVTGVTTVDAPAVCLRARQLLQREDPPVATLVERLGLRPVGVDASV